MQIDKLKHQHIDILRRVAALRTLTHSGVADNAQAIAEGIVGMSAVIKLHLAVEDQALYPSLQRGGDADLARLGRKYQAEMAPLAQAYDAFVRRWNTAQHLRARCRRFSGRCQQRTAQPARTHAARKPGVLPAHRSAGGAGVIAQPPPPHHDLSVRHAQA